LVFLNVGFFGKQKKFNPLAATDQPGGYHLPDVSGWQEHCLFAILVYICSLPDISG
jgi:hypothetical protein